MPGNSRNFPSVKDNEFETKVLSILGEIDDPIDSWFAEDYHCLSSKGNHKKLILKLCRRKDAKKVLLNKNNLKNVDPETVNLPSGTIIYGPSVKNLEYKEHTIVLDEQWFDPSSVKKRSSIHHYAWLRFGKSFSCSSNFWL